MRATARTLIICRLAFTLFAIWIWTAQPASAGDGGADLGGLQAIIGPPDGSDGLCSFLGMSPCPQLPTITQAVLEIAGLSTTAPEVVRAYNAVPMGAAVDAANPSHPPALRCVPATSCTDPLNPITFPVDPGILSTLNPLAFVSARNNRNGPAATHLYDPAADMFLYAVAGMTSAGQPDTLVLFYDDPSRTNNAFPQGKVAAKISLPLTVLNNGNESAAPALLQFKPGTAAQPCSASTITGNFGSGTQTLLATAVGVNCAVVFSASPASLTPHAIFEVAVPLLVTGKCDPIPCPPSPNTDPAYFNPLGFSFFTPPFAVDDTGFSLGASGSVGIAPAAAPLGGPPASGTPAIYPLCADLPRGDGQNLVPAVAAFYAIAVNGETLLSAPLAPPPLENGKPSIVCPAGM